MFNDLWRTVPTGPGKSASDVERRAAARRCSACRRRTSSISSKRPRRGCSPGSARSCASSAMIAQYFYPQRQTKVMNEGRATYVHYRIMNAPARAAGRSATATSSNSCKSHTNVVFQPDFDDPALLRLQSLCARLCDDAGHRAHRAPTPDGGGSRVVPGHRRHAATRWRVLRDIWANYRDESFISQFLSPRLIRQLRMFHLARRPGRDRGHRVDGDPRRARLSAHPPRAGAAYDVGWIECPTSRSSMSISPATAT